MSLPAASRYWVRLLVPAAVLVWALPVSRPPASGGTQLKFKFVESASFIVAAINGKRSVALALFDEGIQVPAGNVTIPPNHPIPQMGTVIEARYL